MVLAEREKRRENDRESLIQGKRWKQCEEAALHREYINLRCMSPAMGEGEGKMERLAA